MRKWIEDHSQIVALSLVFLGVAVRFVHLTADTPYGLSNSPGLYVDEGYKTLAPRNLVLFGKENWHPQDDYTGWTSVSPVTQYAFYSSFQWFGPSLGSARAASVVWFLLLLVAYVVIMKNQYSGSVLLLGLILLSVECTLFFFTRVALFEIVTVSLMYPALFALKRFEQQKPWLGIGIVVVAGVVALYGVKQNAIFVLGPFLVGILLATSVRRHWNPTRVLLGTLFFLFTGMLLILVAKLGYWIPLGLRLRNIDLFPLTAIVEKFLVHPLLLSDPFLVILANLCVVDLLLNDPRSLLRSFYLCGLVSIVLLGPGMLAMIGGNPLRFYIPILPAYILVFVEWWNQRYVYQTVG